MNTQSSHETLKDDIDVMARTLYGEARGEKVRGLEAVASVIVNRVDYAKKRGGYWWGNTISDVCLRPWQFSCWNANDPNREKMLLLEPGNKMFDTCLRVARRAINRGFKDPTGGATHYHHKAILPAWARSRKPSAEIGNHIFYKDIP